MALTDWVTVVLTGTLVGVTGYYARQTREQTRQMRRAARRDGIVSMLNDALLPLAEILDEQPDYDDLGSLLGGESDSGEAMVDTRPITAQEPFDGSADVWAHFAVTSEDVGDVPGMIESHDAHYRALCDALDQVVELHEGLFGDSEMAAVKVALDVPLDDEVFLLPFDASEGLAEVIDHEVPTEIADGNLAFWPLVRRVIHARMDGGEAYGELESFWTAWVDAAASREGYAFLRAGDDGMATAAEELGGLVAVQSALRETVASDVDRLVEAYDVRVEEVSEPGRLPGVERPVS